MACDSNINKVLSVKMILIKQNIKNYYDNLKDVHNSLPLCSMVKDWKLTTEL